MSPRSTLRVLVLSAVSALSMIALGSGAQAFSYPGESPCGFTFHSESYYFGVYSGYKGTTKTPRLDDAYCFDQGVTDGKGLAAAHTEIRWPCDQAFDDGIQQGLTADPLVANDPSDCSIQGYFYGRALLTVSVRDGRADVVGQGCVDDYKQGYADGLAHTVTGSFDNNHDSACYQAGMDDATAGIH